MKICAYAVAENVVAAKSFTAALTEYAIPEELIFIAPPAAQPRVFRSLTEALEPGDLLCLHTLADLGTSLQQILQHWQLLTQVLEVDVVVLTLPLADTRRGPQVTALVAELLEFSAAFTRNQNSVRAKKGVKSAAARGNTYGRPRLPLPANFEQTVLRWHNQQINLTEAARLCDMSESTFWRRATDWQRKN